MANTVQHDMSTNTGFKNIQDYLQEANLYSVKKSGNNAAEGASMNASMLDRISNSAKPVVANCA